jgi:predicted ATPase
LRGDLSPWQQVRAILASQSHLLVLDNYEHLLPDVELLIDLLHYAPQTRLLVTSRERLALQAEHLHELTGLDYPHDSSATSIAKPSRELTSFAAVQLFLQRVHQLQPRFAPHDEELRAIVRICRISEGMPLALELAAAAAREQSCMMLAALLEQGQAHLTARLRDLPERHRTLAAVFEHSWRLLSSSEQNVLAALSVFRGGFEAAAAQAVASATPAILAALIDKSWLRRHPSGRYDIHELVRQYASQQLVASGEFAVVQQRYATYFFQWAEEAQTGMMGGQPTEWMIRIEQDIDNLRAVLKWLALNALEDGLAMTVNLHWLWQSRRYLQEGRDWYALMLAHDTSGASIVRADAYDHAGLLAIMANQIDQAEGLLTQSLALHQQLDPVDPQVGGVLASVLNHLGVVSLYHGDYQQAVQLCHQGLAIAQQCGNRGRASSAFMFAGEAFYLQGSFEEARRSFEECCRINEGRGGLRPRAYSYVRLGHGVCAQGDLRQASTLFAQGLRFCDECHDLAGTSMALIGLARTAALAGEYERAAILTAAKEEMLALNPIMRFWPLERTENERTLALLHAHLDDTTFATAWAKGAAMSTEEAVAYALAGSGPQ